VILLVADRAATEARSGFEHQVGGAELTDLAAVEACPRPIVFRRWRDIEAREIGRAELIVVSNAASAPRALIDAVTRTRRHVLFEHDLRPCRWRGDFCVAGEPLHRFAHRCRCAGLRWHALFESALGVIYLTERQRAAYYDNPHFLPPAREAVLGGSLFSAEVIELCRALARRGAMRSHTAYAWSDNAIKGHRVARDHCRRAEWALREIRRRPYPEVLAAMSASERFVYLPVGLEPAGRMPVEARLCGCEVVVNAQVGVAGEPLWAMDGDRALAWLADGPARFWRLVEALANGRDLPTVGATVRAGSRLGLWDLATVRRRSEIADHWLSHHVAERVMEVTGASPWRASALS
jgi:hypothetical protein